MAALSATTSVSLAVATAEGEFLAHYSPNGLAGLRFPGARPEHFVENLPEISEQVMQWHQLTTTAIEAILAGRSPDKLPPLDLSRGTKFQQSVWAALRRIKFGQTQSYGAIAAAIRNPKAVRAVGGACGANPIPLLVPCHRVLAANKKLGGFSGGLAWKRRLLTIENIRVT
jgi:methylated-DNA-[protein]-cysteine S-methyltransferase